MSCGSIHKLDHSEYILICTLPKRHRGKHTFSFKWTDKQPTSLNKCEDSLK